MKKNILYIILFIVGFSTNSFSADIVRYQTENRSSILDDATAATIVKAAASSNLNFKTKAPICGDLFKFTYSENEKLKSKTKVEAQKFLTDFNHREGTFTCTYVNNQEFGEAAKTITMSIPNWTLLLGFIDGTKKGSSLASVPIDIDDVYNLFDGEFKPNNLSVMPSFKQYETTWEAIKRVGKDIFTLGNSTNNTNSIQTNNYNVEKRAKELGLTYLAENRDSNNFTVAQFVSGLMVLNSDVVTGINEMGDIVINPEIEKKMSILDDIEYSKGIWDTFKDKVGDIYGAMTGAKTEEVNYKSVFSFEQYFDKKIFGLYYDFMAIGWQAVFNYGGIMIIAMIFLYTGSIVGFKYVSFRMNQNNEGKDFDFPMSNRLSAIVAMIAFFFIHFSVGTVSQSQLNPNDKDFQITTTQTVVQDKVLESSGYKIVIGFLSNLGATVADMAATNATVAYMKYLFNATHTRSYGDTVEVLNATRREIVEQAVLQSFFKDVCIASHKNNYAKLNGFGTANSHIDHLWGVDTGSKMIFNDKGTVSPLLCKNIELSLMIGRKYLKQTKAVAEKTITNLSNNSKLNLTTSNSSYTTMSQLYVDTQLLGVKSVGWFMASTLPVSHIFMLNSNIINNTHDGLARTTNGEAVTTMLLNESSRFYQNTGGDNSVHQQTLDSEFLGSGAQASNWVKNTLSTTMSYQIYNMLPMFNEIRQYFERTVEGASESLFEVVGIFLPAGKLLSFSKSALSKFEKEKNELNSKRNKKSKKDNGDGSDDGSDDGKMMDIGVAGFTSFLTYIAAFSLAVIFYKLMIQALFAGLVTLLAILKIGLYFWDCFVHFFVSPFIVLYQMTVKERTDKIGEYFKDGFILYVIRPTLIVVSFFMFIISFEILVGTYSLIFDLIFSTLNLSNSLYEDSSFALSFITQSAITGFSGIFIYFIGMVLAYFMVLRGDDMILKKFKYSDDGDSGLVGQIGDRMQTIGGGRI